MRLAHSLAAATVLLLGAPLPACAILDPIFANPRAGEPFTVVGHWESPAPCRGGVRAKSIVEGSTIRLVPAEGHPPAPLWTSAQAYVPGLAAGTYSVINEIPNGRYSAPVYGTVVVAPATPPASPALRGLDGNWFNDAESGWGVNIVQGESGNLIVAWMTYYAAATAPSWNTWWISTGGTWIAPNRFRAPLLHVIATAVESPTFNPAQTDLSVVGEIDLTFTDDRQVRFEGRFVEAGSCSRIEKRIDLRRMAF